MEAKRDKKTMKQKKKITERRRIIAWIEGQQRIVKLKVQLYNPDDISPVSTTRCD